MRPEDGGGCAFFDSRALPPRPHPRLRPCRILRFACLYVYSPSQVCLYFIHTYVRIHTQLTHCILVLGRSLLCPLPLAPCCCYYYYYHHHCPCIRGVTGPLSHAAVSLAIPWFLVFLCLCLRRIPYVKYILSHAAHRTQPEPAVLLPSAYRCRCSPVS